MRYQLRYSEITIQTRNTIETILKQKTSIIYNLYVIETKNVSFNGNSTDFFSSENKWYFELVEIDQKPKKIGVNGVIRTILKAEKN